MANPDVDIPPPTIPKDDIELARRGFKIGPLLCEGSFGAVFLGDYFDINCAIKKIDMLAENTELPLVIMEMLVIKKIRHKNVVRVLDFYLTWTFNLLIFMEYLDGEDLRELLAKETKLTEVQTAKLYWQFGSGLAFMHNRGFAHRDLKPENILLDKNRKVAKLCDFGLSMPCYDVYTGNPIKLDDCDGTCHYMAPEVIHQMYRGHTKWYCAEPKQYCPFLADVWAMGIITYEMLHGDHERPFNMPKDEKWDFKLAYEKTCKVPKKLDKLFNAELSNAVKDFVARHLKLKQKHRPDMDELMEDKWIVIHQVLGRVKITSEE